MLTPYDVNPLFSNQTGQSSSYISPEVKFSGIGKALLQNLVLWADTHLKWVIGHVRVGNIPAENLAKSCGYQPLGFVAPNMRLWIYTPKRAKL